MFPFHRTALRAAAAPLIAAHVGCLAPACAQEKPFPLFTATLSNNRPLAFGITAEDAARALGTPLSYVSGQPGDEILLAIRHVGGSGLFPRNDPLYLQFRHGRLTGWKGDWGSRWIWQ